MGIKSTYKSDSPYVVRSNNPSSISNGVGKANYSSGRLSTGTTTATSRKSFATKKATTATSKKATSSTAKSTSKSSSSNVSGVGQYGYSSGRLGSTR